MHDLIHHHSVNLEVEKKRRKKKFEKNMQKKCRKNVEKKSRKKKVEKKSRKKKVEKRSRKKKEYSMKTVEYICKILTCRNINIYFDGSRERPTKQQSSLKKNVPSGPRHNNSNKFIDAIPQPVT